jgi:hypothetical protein
MQQRQTVSEPFWQRSFLQFFFYSYLLTSLQTRIFWPLRSSSGFYRMTLKLLKISFPSPEHCPEKKLIILKMFRNQSKMVGLKAYDRWFLLLKQVLITLTKAYCTGISSIVSSSPGKKPICKKRHDQFLFKINRPCLLSVPTTQLLKFLQAYERSL